MPVRKHGNENPPESSECKTRSGFRLRRLIGSLFVLLLLILSAAVFLHRSLLRAYAPGILSQLSTEMRVFYDLDFTYDGYRIDHLSDFTITGVEITDIRTGLPFLYTNSIRIQTSLPAMTIRGKNPLKAVTSVSLENPVITLGKEEEKWNTGTLFEPGDGEPFQFPGRLGIHIHNGKIIWLGGEISDGYPLRPLEINRLEGIFRLGVQGGMGVSLDGQISSDGIEPSNLSVTGNYDVENFLMQLNAGIETLDLEYVDVIADNMGLHDIDGFADGFLISVLIGPGTGDRGFSILGQGTLRDGAVNTDLLNLSGNSLAGDLYFSHESVFSPGLEGVVDGANASVSGRLTNFGAPMKSTDLYIEATGLHPSFINKFAADFDTSILGGSLNAKATVATSVEKGVEVILGGNSSNLSILMFPATVPEFTGWFSDKKFVVNSVEIQVMEGTVHASGVVDTSPETRGYDFEILAGNIPARQIAQYLMPSAESMLSGEGTVSGEISVFSNDAGEMQVTGVIGAEKIAVLSIEGLGDISASFPFEFNGSDVNFQGATVSADGVTLLSEGRYSLDEGFNGSVTVTVNKKELISSITGLQIEGEFAVAGDISFNPAAGLNFNGEGYLTDGRFSNMVVPNLSSRIVVDDEAIRISELSGVIGSGALEGELVIPLDRSQAYDSAGHINISGLDIGPLLPEKYSTVIATSLNISGDAEYVGIDNKVVLNMLLTEESARIGPSELITLEDGLRIVSNFPLDDISAASAEVTGRIELRQAGAPVYQGRELSEFSERIVSGVTNLLAGVPEGQPAGAAALLPQITGIFNIESDFTNLLGETTGHLRVVGDDIRLPSINITSADLSVGSSDGIEWAIDLSLDAGDAGTFNIDGVISRSEILTNSMIDLNTTVQNSALSGLFEAAGLAGYERSSGFVSGTGTVSGTLANPIIDEFVLNVGESEAFGIQISQGEASFSLSPPELNLDSLNLEGASGFRALGAGMIDLKSPSLTSASLVLRVDEFDLDVISVAFEMDFPVSGILSGTVQLSQDAKGPNILYNASIAGLSYLLGEEYIPLGDLSLSASGRPGTDTIQIGSLTLVNGDESISLSGAIPARFDISALTNLNLSLDSDSGYTIPVPEKVVESGIEWSGGLGPTHLTMTGGIIGLSGQIGLDLRDIRYFESTVAQAVSGTLNVQNAVITVAPDSAGITGTDWVLGFDGRLDLAQIIPYLLTGTASFGHLSFVQMTNTPIRFSGPGFNFSLVPGIGENALGIDLGADRNGFNATASGLISIAGGQVDISRLPEFPQSEQTESEPLSGFTFDIQTEITSNVRVQNGNMMNVNFQQGGLTLEGSVARPELTGKIIANDGWIDLLGNHFVLIEPLEFTFTRFHSISDPRINATAQTQLRNVQSPGFYGEDLVITANIDGQLSRLIDNLHLSSEPPLSEDSIIAALAYEDFIFRSIGNTLLGDGPSSAGFSDVDITGMSLSFATSYLSRHIRRKAGFTDFEISLDERQNLMLYLEKEVFDNVVMYYRQSFGPDAEDEYLLGARYRWRPRSWVGLEFNGDDEITPRIQYIIPIR